MADKKDNRSEQSDVSKTTKWSKTWGERLAVEDKMAQLSSNPEHASALTEDPDQARRRNATIDKFRLGAKRLCATHIWARLLKHKGLDQLSPPAQARALGIASQQIRHYFRGDLSLGNWIAFLTDLGLSLSAFDELPAEAARAVAGYQLAIAWIEADAKWADTVAVIGETELRAVLAIVKDESFMGGRERGLPTDAEWLEVAGKIDVPGMPKVKTPAQCRERAHSLSALYRRWSTSVNEVVNAIPHRWLAEGAS